MPGFQTALYSRGATGFRCSICQLRVAAAQQF
ncbi:hypothetical protein EMQ25_10415 [Arsenicitalea aurantiaca]|uniref:Zinc finger LSD1-type domain-containing protein n=1 Tax=Arsenicitalea aurantiaca TaxID=1783274 RepID=A0A433XB31_9HYPH|nr:hypothetical protein EMQ25_10415 [Arsenicitalea aurantiaca]